MPIFHSCEKVEDLNYEHIVYYRYLGKKWEVMQGTLLSQLYLYRQLILKQPLYMELGLFFVLFFCVS